MRNKNRIAAAAALALVIGSLAACGTVTKNAVDLKPTAGVTETPEPTKEVITPEPTETPVPTAEVTETPEPTAEVTPEPIVEVTPEVTEEPTPTVEVIITPEVTEEPDPTLTPAPTATATPEPTATATPKPTATPAPTETPKLTATPAPTATPVPEKKYEASIEGIKELRSEVPEEFILNDDYMVASIKKWFNDDGAFASVSTEELITYYCECKNKPEFTLNLPEEMMNDWVQQNKTPWIHGVGTWRNFVASKVMFIEKESPHPDFSDYEEAEPALLSVDFDGDGMLGQCTYKVGTVYREDVQVTVLGESEYLLGERTMDYYNAAEKFYYDAQSNVGTHIDFTFDIKVFEDEEYAQTFKVYVRDCDESKLRSVTSEEVTIAVGGYNCYLQFNKPGYYSVKEVPVNLVTGEVYTYIPPTLVHVIE